MDSLALDAQNSNFYDGFQPPKPPPLPPLPLHRLESQNANRLADSKLCLSNSSLCDAIKRGQLLEAVKLLNEGSDVNEATLLGSPLSIAVRENSMEMVQLLVIQWQCDINLKDYDGETALQLSLRKGHDAISLYLIYHGANMDTIDPVTGLPPLCTAVSKKNIEIVKAMIERNCYVDMKDRNNQTALVHACLLPEASAAAETNTALEKKYAGGMWTSAEASLTAEMQKKTDIIKLLVDSGADMNTRAGPPFHGYLIHKIILEKCYSALEALLSYVTRDNMKALDLNVQSAVDKNSPLHLAVSAADATFVELLLINGASTDIFNVFGDTPLSKALKDHLYDQSPVIELLLSHGANPNFESVIPNNAIRKGPGMPLFAAIERGSKQYVDLLLKYGASLAAIDFNGHCPIMPCLSDGVTVNLLRYIVDLMDQQNVEYDISSWDYLKNAFQWQSHLQYLIDRGLNVHAKSRSGYSILHTNAVKLYPGSLEILLRNGLDPDALSDDGQTMLCMSAGLSEYWPVLEMLIQYGADIDRRCQLLNETEGLTPIQRSFLAEYNEEFNNKYPSQFRYLANCGAVLPPDLFNWSDNVVADRVVYEFSDDDSTDDSIGSLTEKLSSDWKDELVRDFQALFSPLPLMMICRKSVRMVIIKHHGTANIKQAISLLSIPQRFKEYLGFINVPTSRIIR